MERVLDIYRVMNLGKLQVICKTNVWPLTYGYHFSKINCQTEVTKQ
jgi:hypothetical protein